MEEAGRQVIELYIPPHIESIEFDAINAALATVIIQHAGAK